VSDTKTQRVARKPLIAMVSRVEVVKSARHKLQQMQQTKFNVILKKPDDLDFLLIRAF